MIQCMKVMKGHRESFRSIPYFSVRKLFTLKARKSDQFVEIAGESYEVARLPGAEENIGKAFLGLNHQVGGTSPNQSLSSLDVPNQETRKSFGQEPAKHLSVDVTQYCPFYSYVDVADQEARKKIQIDLVDTQAVETRVW